MKKQLLFLASIATLLLTSCSDISEDERLSYVKPAQVQRAVLIEDFTGQRCVNCPSAADEIHSLQELYGDSAVIAVAIHGGSFGFSGNAKYIGLANDLSKGYCTHWDVDAYGQPIGMVNRGGMTKYDTWANAVREALQQTAPLDLSLSCDYEAKDGLVEIDATALGTNGTTSGYLQLWVVEDSIVAMQLMQDGSANQNYVHNHVLRAAVGGEWGTAIAVAEGSTCSLHFEARLDEAWKPENISIVAFVYNDDGVQQVTRQPIIANK